MEADALHEDCINNRKRLQFCVNILLGLLKRTNNKSNLLPEVVPFINSLIPVTRYFNEMWDPNFRVFCNPILRDKIYASATDADRSHLLEFIQQNTPSSSSSVSVSVDAFSAVSTLNFFNSSFSSKQLAIDRQLQSFLWNQHENLFSLLGTSISCLPPAIVFPQSHLFLSVLNKSQNLPRLKLRAVLKHFVKPYVQNCPNDTVSLTQSLLPLSSSFIPWLFKHIDDRWEVYRCNNNSTTSIGAEGQTTSSDDKNLENEVIEDQSNRLLSREFIELFQSTLISFPVTKDLSSPLKRQPLLDSIPESDDTEMDDSVAASIDSNEPGISEIGRFLLHHNLQSWTTMSFGQLTWVDSAVSLKASKTCYPILKELLVQGVICSAEDVSFILHHIFLALKLFGESEQNKASLIDLLLILFEGLIKNNAVDAVKAPFWLLSQTDESQWLKFQKTFISDPTINSSVSSTAFKGKVSDKRKRDAIKTLLDNLIGVSLALLFMYFFFYVDRCFVPSSLFFRISYFIFLLHHRRVQENCIPSERLQFET